MGPESTQQTRVLVVDDDPSVRDVLCSMLSISGYSVEKASNGREALEKMRAQGFHVILTDLVMPEQEGIETIQLLRQEFPEVKVIAMSGAFGGDYLRIAEYLGAHYTLSKPITLASVKRAIEQTLAQA